MSVLPVDVAGVCAAYLDLVDAHAAGLVEGLYLVGSVALGDYRPGVSDVDFVAVTGRPVAPAVVAAVHWNLRRRGRRPFFDGLYVGWDDLRRDPAVAADGPAVHEWRVEPVSRFGRELVTWHTLAQAGVAVRGPAVGTLGVFTDWPALAAATRANLAGYWRQWLDRTARGPAGLTAGAVSWGVLGVARLLHTLAAGEVTSKSAAGSYALETFDVRWHRVVREAVRIRSGGPPLYRSPWRRRRDLVGFVAAALDRA